MYSFFTAMALAATPTKPTPDLKNATSSVSPSKSAADTFLHNASKAGIKVEEPGWELTTEEEAAKAEEERQDGEWEFVGKTPKRQQ
jgi:hypothetical protein